MLGKESASEFVNYIERLKNNKEVLENNLDKVDEVNKKIINELISNIDKTISRIETICSNEKEWQRYNEPYKKYVNKRINSYLSKLEKKLQSHLKFDENFINEITRINDEYNYR